jgi:hypothetical protein
MTSGLDAIDGGTVAHGHAREWGHSRHTQTCYYHTQRTLYTNRSTCPTRENDEEKIERPLRHCQGQIDEREGYEAQGVGGGAMHLRLAPPLMRGSAERRR